MAGPRSNAENDGMLRVFKAVATGIDPIVVAHPEALTGDVRETFAIVIVSRPMQQVARVPWRTAPFRLGNLVEVGDTKQILTNLVDKRTQDYITGRIG